MSLAIDTPRVMCPCPYPDIDPDTKCERHPDGVCVCGHVADEHSTRGSCQATFYL